MRWPIPPLRCTTAARSPGMSSQAAQASLLKLPLAHGFLGVSVTSVYAFGHSLWENVGAIPRVRDGRGWGRLGALGSRPPRAGASWLGLRPRPSAWRQTMATAPVSVVLATQTPSSAWISNSRVSLQGALSDGLRSWHGIQGTMESSEILCVGERHDNSAAFKAGKSGERTRKVLKDENGCYHKCQIRKNFNKENVETSMETVLRGLHLIF